MFEPSPSQQRMRKSDPSLNEKQLLSSKPIENEEQLLPSKPLEYRLHCKNSEPAPPEQQIKGSELKHLFPHTFRVLTMWLYNQNQCIKKRKRSERAKNQQRVITSEPKSFQQRQMNSEPIDNKKQILNSEPEGRKLRKPESNKSKPDVGKGRMKSSIKPTLNKQQPNKSDIKSVRLRKEWKEKIKSMSILELVSAIKIARDKAFDGDPLSPFENYLFQRFLNMGNTTVEKLAEKLKEEVARREK